MAWIHPITAGEYRILYTTSTGIASTSSSISTYDSHAQGDITNWTNLDGIGLTTTDWFALASTLTNDARDQGAKSTLTTGNVPAYTPASTTTGVLMKTDLLDEGVYTSEPKFGDGATNGTPFWVWTGSKRDGTKEAAGLELGGTADFHAAGDDGVPLSWLSGNVTSSPKETLNYIYAVSPIITTVTGSISGTVPTTDDYVIFIGATTLTADIDFGGTVNLKAALDVSQTPSFSGDFFIDIAGGTVTDIPVKIKDSGTGNVFAGNVGPGIQVRS